jgi:JAB1/Mov34/MPN/PAD-1 ubiquitin protease
MISISDHYVRTKVNNLQIPGTGGRVLGILLGQQNGRLVDISNSFELVYTKEDQHILIDDIFLQKKIEQCEF